MDFLPTIQNPRWELHIEAEACPRQKEAGIVAERSEGKSGTPSPPKSFSIRLLKTDPRH